MAQVTVMGNISNDATFSSFASSSRLNFSVADNIQVWDAKSSQYVDKTQYFSCVLFGKRAETMREYITKGRFVTVIGELVANPYVNKDGQPSVFLDINVDIIKLQGFPRQSDK